MKTSEQLIAAKAKISNSKNWTKHRYRRPKGGLLRRPTVAYCAAGALDGNGQYTGYMGTREAWEYLIEAVRLYTGDAGLGIVTFNDKRSTRHKDIMAVYDIAIDLALEREAELAEADAESNREPVSVG